MKKAVKLSAIALLLGAITWNGWIFGGLNHGLAGYSQMSISELEAAGQPSARLFDFWETISGLLMFVGGIGMLAAGRQKLIMVVILATITAIGGLTIYDVAHPLDCNTYQNPVCSARVDTGQISHTQTLHESESRITAYLTILMTLLIVLWAYTERLPRHHFVYFAIVTLGILVTLAILNSSHASTMLDAVSERLWNTLVAVEIAFIAARVLRK